MGYTHICHICNEADATGQIKAGCGCLIHICEDCREDNGAVRHMKCNRCEGGMTLEEEQSHIDTYGLVSYSDEYLDRMFEGDLDDHFDHLEREREHELDRQELQGSFYDDNEWDYP